MRFALRRTPIFQKVTIYLSRSLKGRWKELTSNRTDPTNSSPISLLWSCGKTGTKLFKHICCIQPWNICLPVEDAWEVPDGVCYFPGILHRNLFSFFDCPSGRRTSKSTKRWRAIQSASHENPPHSTRTCSTMSSLIHALPYLYLILISDCNTCKSLMQPATRNHATWW